MDADGEPTKDAAPAGADWPVWKARATFYRTVIERYRDYINEGEQKNVPVLKAAIDPKEPTVQKLRSEIVASIVAAKTAAAGGTVVESRELEYNPETDFDDAAKAAFLRVQSLGKTHSELSISFWLSYAEMESLGIADAFDRCLLLCSLLSSLGCKTAMVSVLLLEDGSTHPVVTFGSQEDGYFLLDACNNTNLFGEDAAKAKQELISGFVTGDGKKATRISYEFNREDYNEYDDSAG
ncbi:MAG: hypothetical protein WCX64_05180 [Candidatus Micrarchaeia archaeon]